MRFFSINGKGSADILPKYFGTNNSLLTPNGVAAAAGECTQCRITCLPQFCGQQAYDWCCGGGSTNTQRLIDAGKGDLSYNDIFSDPANFALLRDIITSADLKTEAKELATEAPSYSEKDLFLSPSNASDTSKYIYDDRETIESVGYYRYSNVFKSNISDTVDAEDINWYIGDPTGTKIIPLVEVTPTNFSKIEKIEIIFKFFSVEGGTPFVPPVLDLWLVKDPNNNDGTPLSKVGATIKTFDVTTPITVGGLKEYRYNVQVPAAFFNLVSVDKTFPTDGLSSITNWSAFVDKINGNITDTNTVYYFALTTNTVSASGKGWFQVSFTAKMSGAGECSGPCLIDGYIKDMENGDCYKCNTSVTDSTYWTVV